VTTRIAVYARHSTDHQSPRSVEDQIKYCIAAAQRTHPDCKIVKTYKDSAISGASLDRPAVQAMLSDVRKGLFDVVYFEDLTRFSRDMADATTVKKEFDFYGLEMWEANGGKLDTMRTGVQSLFGQLFREETARKVYRGMKPRAQEGLHMGGRPFGYKPLIKETRNIDDKGKLKIEEDEEKIVVRIFEERAEGKSPRLIAAGLNKDNIPSPRGGKWNASTINGQKGRGIGIFHNELYIGRYRWNKLQFKKPPGSNKRVSVSKDEAEHVVVDVPEYRIIEQALWDKVQAIIGENGTSHMSHRRTPPRLLSQLLKCPACGGGMSSYGNEKKTGKIRVGCSTHKESRSCPDPRTFYLEWIEETVVETLKKGLAEPAVVERAVKAYEDERRRFAAKAIDEKASVEKRIADLTRKITRLNQMLIDESATRRRTAAQ
jgi:site-specific DNA recombinase